MDDLLTNEPQKPKRGGARPGGGRPVGSGYATKLSRELQARALHGKTKMPLEVMLEAMIKTYEEEGPVAAFPLAERCAPYLHPKLASITAEVSADVRADVRMLPVETMTDEQLQELAASDD